MEVTNSQRRQTQAMMVVPVVLTSTAPHRIFHAYLYFLELGEVLLIHVQIPNMALK
jgi:hypothetical protein